MEKAGEQVHSNTRIQVEKVSKLNTQLEKIEEQHTYNRTQEEMAREYLSKLSTKVKEAENHIPSKIWDKVEKTRDTRFKEEVDTTRQAPLNT